MAILGYPKPKPGTVAQTCHTIVKQEDCKLEAGLRKKGKPCPKIKKNEEGCGYSLVVDHTWGFNSQYPPSQKDLLN